MDDKIKPKRERCAPGVSYKEGSCMKEQHVVALAKAYNKDNPKNPIKLKFTKGSDPGYKQYLLKQLFNVLSDVCDVDDPKCLLKQKYMRHLNKKMHRKLTKNTYRPDGPQGTWEWLNTFDIDDVMKQYENIYKDFEYLGTVPIDFDDLPDLGLKNLNLTKKLKKNKTQFGIVFNLDEHYKGGSHWVALYVNINKGVVFFFDSYGTSPEKRIKTLMKRISDFCKKQGTTPQVSHNSVRHQYGGSECGVYSINFILRMLSGESFETFMQSKVKDDVMNKNRKIYFYNA